MQNPLTIQRIIALVRAELFGKPIDTHLFEGMNYDSWKELFEVSSPHSQSAIAFDAMKHLPKELHPSSTFMIAWDMDTKRQEKEYHKKVKTLEKLSSVFHANGIDKVMVLKGLGTASFYPVPEHRLFSDIDIYLFGEWKKGDEAVREEFAGKIDDSKYHTQSKYVINNILIENHRKFISDHTHSSNKQLEELLEKYIMEEGSTITFGKETLLIPPATFNALFLIRHASNHFASRAGLELRQICDWGMFLKKNNDKVDWEAVDAIFKRFNVYRFVCAINTILTDYFGMDETIIPPFTHETTLAKKIFADIIQQRDESTEKNILRKINKSIDDRWKHQLIYPGRFTDTLLRKGWLYVTNIKSYRKASD